MGGLQFDDDMFSDDGDDDDLDEDEHDAPDLAADPRPITPRPSPAIVRDKPSRRLRMRPMTPRMMRSHPEVVSITLTRNDGRQLVFVRR
jgi:hypothetical protein